MDHRSEAREFLSSRRARLHPADVGLPAYGNTRRVPGLRREEVALLAGVSVEYYIKLERGNLAGASDNVLDALAQALQLDETEREYLYNLARTANTAGKPLPSRHQLRASIQHVLDAITDAAAVVRNGRLDILGTNALGHALLTDMFASPIRPVNHAMFIFLDPAARTFYRDWDHAADDTVAILRAQTGHAPADRALTGLIGQLCTRSEEFRIRWASHNVHAHKTGVKRYHHPIVGDLSLIYEVMELTADPGLTMIIYAPAAGTPSADAMALLASWAAPERPDTSSSGAADLTAPTAQTSTKEHSE